MALPADHPNRRRGVQLAAAVILGGSLAACGSGSAGTGVATVPAAQPGGASALRADAARPSQWTQYHADVARLGAVSASTSFAHLRRAWSDNLGGVVHGQVLAADGRIIAATERNRVVALNLANSKVLWTGTLGRPLTNVASIAGCGDIDPLGITSTPVIDTRTGTVYVVGEVRTGRDSVVHKLEGLSLKTGAVRLSENVDPPVPKGEKTLQLLQRPGLALANGRVYIAFGGNDGDCGAYHGWVVGVRERGAAHRVSFEVASDGEGGAVWQGGGAPAIDSHGHVFVATGNANPDPPQGGPDPKLYTESVVELSATLHPIASFKDRTAGGDEDLSTGNPVLLPHNRLFSVGKTDIGFVLQRPGLHHVLSIHGVCGSDPDGGPAFDAARDVMFVPCRGGGIQVVDLGKGVLGHRLSGADSSPIVVGTHVWALDQSSSDLVEYDAGTGRRMQSVPVGTQIPIFASPSVALGLMLVPTNEGVTALH